MSKSGYSILVVFAIAILAGFAQADEGKYPIGPDLEMTPGVLCTTPNAHRYPEQIAYCDRNVDFKEKWDVINAYMKKFNFVIDRTNRADFKIDHFIPLCMGGANSPQNLWPQHKSVYEITDELELVLCGKLALGKLTQAQAIEKMKTGKLHLDLAPALITETIAIH